VRSRRAGEELSLDWKQSKGSQSVAIDCPYRVCSNGMFHVRVLRLIDLAVIIIIIIIIIINIFTSVCTITALML
jgi:hypothetical protein